MRNRRAAPDRTGHTLLELLVVLILLGILASLGAAAISAAAPTAPDGTRDSVRAARSDAVRQGRPFTRTIGGAVLRFLPDGQVLGGLADPLTGVPDAAP